MTITMTIQLKKNKDIGLKELRIVDTNMQLDNIPLFDYHHLIAFLASITKYEETKNLSLLDKTKELNELLKTSDIVSIHCPLNEQTKGLIGEESFKLMKKEAILINVGRGGIVDEKALAEALENKEIAGAGLDVFESEPLAKESPLLQINDASKILMTPHIAWATVEARNRLFDLVVDNIQGFLKGDLKNVC